ncbi:putative solute carrier family 39 [Danaus plexippus plexippus]|uniref:Zinc transporter ZIP11 n=1 Tax=Danaus plexippus plexippus TaxID=278856 RepID=A0A212ENT8_DANPL|nr:putative solute carrier family 39 [Danaus plexippus plexippus]
MSARLRPRNNDCDNKARLCNVWWKYHVHHGEGCARGRFMNGSMVCGSGCRQWAVMSCAPILTCRESCRYFRDRSSSKDNIDSIPSNLALGIGIQNFPEGLAVSLPLHSAGFSVWRAFWYGQLSGMVEPVFGVLGAVAVAAAQPALPYALAFAAGAMIYVVADDIIPEANASGNGKLATWGCIVGFVVMMSLDVGLG